MRNVIMIILAVLLVCVVWRVVEPLFYGLSGDIVHLAVIALFCCVVYVVYKALNRQNIL